jgi:protein-S-isoprenylcysteine O-methyltransferase Ste14
MNKPVAYTMMAAAYLLGGLSLLWFGLFLFFGPFFAVDLGLSPGEALLLDGALCLLFFLQHSIMVRRSFQRRLGAVVPDHYHGAIYSIASGIALIAFLLFWQPTGLVMAAAGGPLRWLLRGLFIAATLGGLWGFRALGSFDGFGIRPIKLELQGKTRRETALTIRGPYRWVRHPMYLVVLIQLWSYPDITADRLLLNASFTVWTVIGSVLEERDLVAAFGDPYREYQREVPMLLPLKPPRRSDGR